MLSVPAVDGFEHRTYIIILSHIYEKQKRPIDSGLYTPAYTYGVLWFNLTDFDETDFDDLIPQNGETAYPGNQ